MSACRGKRLAIAFLPMVQEREGHERSHVGGTHITFEMRALERKEKFQVYCDLWFISGYLCLIHLLYRCLRCKQVCNHVPDNAYHITCGNCMKQFTYKEVGLIFHIAVIHFASYC